MVELSIVALRCLAVLAFIGFGEVGQTFARQLLARSGVEIAAYDVLFDRAQGRVERIAQARSAGVRVAADAADASRDASVVFSAVTAAAASSTAPKRRWWMRRGMSTSRAGALGSQ